VRYNQTYTTPKIVQQGENEMSFKEQVAIGYAKEAKVLGAIVQISFLDETVLLMDEDGKVHKASFDEVIELREIGVIGKTIIYEHDVLSTEDGKKYEIMLDDDGVALLFSLDKKLNRQKDAYVRRFRKELIGEYKGVLAVVGNIFELRDKQPKVDFNIAMVRHIDENDGDVKYYQAGNNKELEEVDLFKAIMFEDEEYERITLSYEDFLDAVANGEFKIVDHMEFENYITGLAYSQDDVNEPCCDEQCCDTCCKSEDDKDFCDSCGEHEEYCDCELWTK
jgi:hypothetical protein